MIVYRPMQENDLDTVTALEAAAFSKPWQRKDFADALNSPNYLYYVAEQDGQVIANAGLIMSIDEADLTNVTTAEACRGRGIAKMLLENLMQAAKERGIVAFTLEVRAGNAAAIALYEKLGFVCEGRRKNFYTAPAEDALIYWLRENI